MEIESRRDNEVLIIELKGEKLDAEVVQHFTKECTAQIGHAKRAWVVLDLHQLKCIDSTGLGSLLSLLRQISGQGGDLRLALVQPSVGKMLEAMRMDQIFERFSSVKAAIDSFSSGSC